MAATTMRVGGVVGTRREEAGQRRWKNSDDAMFGGIVS